MNSVEIVKGLQSLNIIESWPDKREFYVQGVSAAEYQAIVAAAAAELTPRVLARDEIAEYDGAVYIEEESGGDITMALCTEDYWPDMEFRDKMQSIYSSGDEYGVTWRCWTKRPTDEQRKAEPWER